MGNEAAVASRGHTTTFPACPARTRRASGAHAEVSWRSGAGDRVAATVQWPAARPTWQTKHAKERLFENWRASPSPPKKKDMHVHECMH
eukprot:366344-Chlamydomonas_euryale.AAC.16